MRSGWTVKPLKDLCENFKSGIVDGPFGSNLKREHFTTSGVPVLKIQNVKPFQLNDKKLDFVTVEKAKELKRHSFKRGDIIMTKLGDPLGISAIVESVDAGIIVADLVRIRTEKIDTKFLCYQLNSPLVRNILNSQQQGATRPRVQISMVRDLPIVFPSLEEQRRIVAELDRAFAGIATATANAQTNLTNARALLESHRNATLATDEEGWTSRSLGSVCDFLNGFAFKSTDTITQSNVQLIRMGNLYQNNLDLDRKPSYYPEAFSDTYARYRLDTGDLIISLTGTVGKEDYGFVVEIPLSHKTLLLNQRIAKFTNIDRSKTTKDFLLHLLRSRVFLDKLYASSRGTRQANLSTVTMKSMQLPFPPTEIQNKIVATFDSLGDRTTALALNYQRKLDALSELKRSLLQKAFVGELI